MTINIDDLVQSLTPDEVNEQFLSILETIGMPARSWRQGGIARTILKTVATTYSGFTYVMSAAIKAGFLDSATGDWLTLLAHYVYGVDRRPATFATGNLTFTNGGGGVYSWIADQVRVTWDIGKKDYVNTGAWTISGGQTLDVPFRAVEVGSASSAPSGSITDLQTVMLGVTVTNIKAIAGNDAETDVDLRQRCRDKLGSLSFDGPRGAYAYAVTSAVRIDGTPVDINRVDISPSSSTGVVNIYCASPSGTPLSADLALATASVEAIARPDSVTANVFGVTSVTPAIALTIWARRTYGVTEADITNAANAALVNLIKSYPIGGLQKPPSSLRYLYAETIEGTVQASHPAIFTCDGAPDTLLTAGQVAEPIFTMSVSWGAP